MTSEASWGQVGTDFLPPEGEVIEKKIAVLGHSYVRDLPMPSRHVLGHYTENRIALCRKFFVPGATVDSIQTGNVWQRFTDFKPDLTFMIIGGNDITYASQPAVIARKIIQLAKRVKEETGGEVRIVTIEKRSSPRGLTVIRYNRQRTSINRYLKTRDPFTLNRLIFSEATLSDFFDGVHLRNRAIQELANLLVWHLEKFANSQ